MLMKQVMFCMRIVFVFFACISAKALLAQQPVSPSSEEIMRVFHYYQQGVDVVLTESITCGTIGNAPPRRFECIDPMDPDQPIQRYGEGYLWTSLLVPVDYSGMLEYRFIHEGKVINTSRVSVSPSLRYRVWKFLPTHISGNWQVELRQLMHNEEKSITRIDYRVK